MGRVAVVTGAASGIGLAVSRQLADRGHPVGLFDLDGDGAERSAASLRANGAAALGCGVDVADRASIEAALQKARSQFGPVQIMVTSAAISAFESFTDITLESWNRMLAVNLTGTFHCLQAVIPDMVAARWGRIVTLSSAAGQIGAARMAHYAASKGGVISLTKTLAQEYGRLGITVNCIPPFVVDTPMSRAAQAEGNVAGAAGLAAQIPVGRLGAPDDIAAACVFLCSDEASYVTGQVIGVNGGIVL